MSSTVNNNQLIPPASTNSVAEGSSRGPVSNVQVASRSQQNQPTSAQGKGRFGRPRRGRGGRIGLQAFRSDAQQPAVQHSQEGTGQANENDYGTSGQSQSSNLDHSNSNLQPGTRSRPQRIARGSGGGGKYRQRQQTSQLIDGLDGLDIDLVESLAPTNTTGQTVSSGKGRHATNSRKVNLTHLLNYRYDRRQPGARQRNSSFGDSNVGHHRSNYSHYRDYGHVHKFSKQQFLQANCQFVVLDGHDYTVHKVDPDWPVEWDCIEEVKFRQIASTETTCPICLEPPVAAKITRCGHIYCWTCMLHYLALSDENCRQCPICFEPVYRSDLRSVVSQFYPNHAVEEEIVMRLMIRKKGCVEVEPYWKEFVSHQNEPNTSANAEHYCSQANLVIVDPQTVISKVAQREKDELMLKLERDRDEPEVCFIERALDGLNKRIERLQVLAASTSPTATKHGQNRVNASDDAASSKSYLFYQSADGQHIYLNPFSTKILCQQYGSLENCPLELKAKILQMDWVSMSEGWRKRFKYLEHLPLTCEFRLIEIDFEKSEIVSREIFSLFEDQIRLRANERERRRREERKREKIIQVEQNRKIYGIQPSLKINLNNPEQFPSVSDERYLGLSKPRTQSAQDSDDDADDTSDETDDVNVAAEIAGETETPQPSLSSDGATTGVTLSFRDIQLQEAVHAAKANPASNVWGQSSSKAKGGVNQPSQSSFAKLLVDAKTSQKEWTKSGTTTRNSQASFSNQSQAAPGSSTSRQTDDGQGEGDEEELRAPPSEFTISDFIDINVVSGSTKRGKGTKPKNSRSKKG